MSRLNRLRTLGGLRGRALSGSDSIGNGLRADVVAYYKLGDVNDSGPNGYTLTNNNGVTFGAGKVGNCATFNDAGNTSLSRSGADLDITTADFAFAFWLKTAADDDWLFTKGVAGPTTGYNCYITAGVITVQIRDGTGIATVFTAGAALNDDLWHHIAINGDRDGSLTIYADAVAIGSGSIASRQGSLATVQSFYLAKSYANDNDILDGSLDEFGFWRRLLAASEIAHLSSGIALY